MSFKKFGVVLLAVLMVSSVVSATSKEFKKGGFYLTPQIGFNSWTIPFGVNAEYAMTENIGIAGTVMVWLWSDEGSSSTVINPMAEVNYHFTKLNAEKFDLYAGAGLGYAAYSFSSDFGFEGSGASGLNLALVFGGRYYFQPKMAVSLRLVGSLVGDWSGFGGTVGVTFVLK